MNQVNTTVVGNLLTPVEKRVTTTGRTLSTFRVAGNERRFDRATGSWVRADSVYLRVTCWQNLAENVHASLGKGDPVIVHGRLRSRSYEQDGRPQYVTDLEAHAVGPDLTRSTAVVTRTRRPAVGDTGAEPGPTSGDGERWPQEAGAAPLGPDDEWAPDARPLVEPVGEAAVRG
jgi:single-strand DNA-binding protein